jgi:hypothetical protein|tara:strand:- start:191 stop:883 length:693 start_codon:yes stop_codon:yes gene_type:complete
MENKFDELFKNIQITDNSSPLITILCLFLTIFCSYILKYVYEKKSISLSSKYQLSSIIPILSATTYLVILIVKSSLALSLGLVGALSIVRFRTPVKEPEDLVYLFLSIAIGIGFGAFQIFSTLIVFLIIIIFIWFRSYKFDQVRNDYNLELTFNNNEIYQKNSNEIIQLLKKNSESLEFIRQDRDESGKIELNIRIRFKEFEQIKTVTKKLQEIDKALIKFSIYETKILF